MCLRGHSSSWLCPAPVRWNLFVNSNWRSSILGKAPASLWDLPLLSGEYAIAKGLTCRTVGCRGQNKDMA